MELYDYFEMPSSFPKKYIQISFNDSAIKTLKFTDFKNQKETTNSISSFCKMELQSYFDGKLLKFNLPLDLVGTSFQQKVWEELCLIPYGETYSYKDLANKIGGSKYSRSVGNANSKNPIPLIVPCHRVIKNNGELGGYSGGIEIKKWFLDFEYKNYNQL